MGLAEIIRQGAAYAGDTLIEVDESLPSVAIGEHVFMQGDEAQHFIDEANDLYEGAQTVTMDEVYAHLAGPYLDLGE
jgi:hypothetical protein